MTLTEMSRIVQSISYKPGWSITLSDDGSREKVGRPFIQIAVDETAEAARCPFTGKVEPWRGGKRYLSKHMCKQEVVGACLDAFKSAEMHEIHEWFKYKGRSIYNPHLCPDALAELVGKKENLCLRKNAMSMAE